MGRLKNALDYNESLYSRVNRLRQGAVPERSSPTSWESALREAESELKRARVLVEALEMLTGHLRERMLAGDDWPGAEDSVEARFAPETR